MPNPRPPDLTIDLQDQNAGENDVNKGSTIAWHNGTNSQIEFNPPGCVSPPTEVSLAPGGTTQTYTVNGTKGDSYSYNFTVGASVGTRNGTIKVND